jgi:hypothetical protein
MHDVGGAYGHADLSKLHALRKESREASSSRRQSRFKQRLTGNIHAGREHQATRHSAMSNIGYA